MSKIKNFFSRIFGIKKTKKDLNYRAELKKKLKQKSKNELIKMCIILMEQKIYLEKRLKGKVKKK
jgi:hypothetical protein